MKNSEVSTGGTYKAKVSNKVTEVRIIGEALYGSGWDAINLETGRKIHIRSARRLRERVV
jgi:hypothetical protein